jgi:hypothetical protein
MSRSGRIKSLLASAQRTADGTQKSFMRAEDGLSAIEEREAKRSHREAADRADVSRRMKAVGGDVR